MRNDADADADSDRWPMYRLIGAVVHQPRLLRMAASLIRRLPVIEDNLSVAARFSSASQVFRRQTSYSNTSHAPNLVAGEFVIGMESGPRHDDERRFVAQKLPSPQECGDDALRESRAIAMQIGNGAPVTFDLIEDYMVRVVWAGMRGIFGPAAQAIEDTPPSSGTQGGQPARMAEFFREMRYPGAHLIVGQKAPSQIQERAEASAAALNTRVSVNLAGIRAAWGAEGSDAKLHRNAVGLMWVGHPATTQAGALVMQELLGRPKAYNDLLRQAQAPHAGAQTDAAFRDVVRSHVIESLRFRPPFPILSREVPRDTEYELPDGRRHTTKAGCPMTLLGIGAMFDRDAVCRAEVYDPSRPLDERGDSKGHYFIFGDGDRACPAQDHVIEILTSALLGLLMLPRLTWADRWFRRIRYDGPIITRLRLKSAD